MKWECKVCSTEDKQITQSIILIEWRTKTAWAPQYVTEIKGNLSNSIKGIYENPTANITLSGERLKAFLQGPQVWTLKTSIHIVLQVIGRENTEEEKATNILIGDLNSKTISILKWHDLVYRKS
jgi:hypothetical protein